MSHEKISHGEPTLQVLPDIVKQVMYLPDNDYIISSTSSGQQSLVISPADRKDFKKSYVFNIDKVPGEIKIWIRVISDVHIANRASCLDISIQFREVMIEILIINLLCIWVCFGTKSKL